MPDHQLQRFPKQQQKTLIEIITMKFGGDLSQEDFVDQVLMLFEDVAEMEAVEEGELRSITNNLWRQYHGNGSSREEGRCE